MNYLLPSSAVELQGLLQERSHCLFRIFLPVGSGDMHDGLMARPLGGTRTPSRTGAALTSKRVLMGVVTMMLCVRVLIPTDGYGGVFAFENTDIGLTDGNNDLALLHNHRRCITGIRVCAHSKSAWYMMGY